MLGIITMTTMTKMKPGMEGKSQGFSGQGSPYSAVVNPACIAVIVVVIVIFVVIVINVARSLMVFSSTFPRLFQQKCSAHEKWIPWIDNGHIDSFYRRATDTFYSIGEQWISEYLNSTSLQSIALLYLDVPMFQWRWAQTANKRSDSHNIQWLSTQNWAVDETVITGN